MGARDNFRIELVHHPIISLSSSSISRLLDYYALVDKKHIHLVYFIVTKNFKNKINIILTSFFSINLGEKRHNTRKMEKDKFLQELCRKEKLCSMKKAMSFAAKGGYHPELVKVIIERKDCSFPYLWDLLEKTWDIPWVIKSAVKNDSFKKIYYDQFVSLFIRSKEQGSNYHHYAGEALKILAERKILNKFSGEQLLNFSKKFTYESPVISGLGKTTYWKKMSKELAFQILKRVGGGVNYNDCLAKIFIDRQDCGFQEALEILRDSENPPYVFPSIIKRKDFKLPDILKNLNKIMENTTGSYSADDIICLNFEQIIARQDCSLTLADKLLEISRKSDREYGSEFFVSSVAALIKKNNVSFEKAFALMEEIECDKYAIASFEKREDFGIEKRIKLAKMMGRFISIIYERGDEPSFDSDDIKKIIKNGDWINFPLRDALRFCKNQLIFEAPLSIISERKDWKELSLAQAIELAVENGNQNHILGLIIKTKNCPLEKALELAKSKKGDDSLYDAQLVSLIIKLKLSSCEESLQILTKSDDPFWTVTTLVEQRNVSLRVMANLLMNGFSNLANLSFAASKHEDWKTIPLEDAFDFLSKPGFYSDPLFIITAREDWRALSFQAAYDLLNKLDWSCSPQAIVWSLTEKKDCPLDLALKFLSLLDPKSDIRKALIPVLARRDYPLEKALELAKNSYYGSFKGITLRSDWKELPLSQIYQYIERYPDHDLINSLAERADWKALSTEAAEKELLLKGYYRNLYLGLIVRQETRPLEEAMAILEKAKYDSGVAEQFIQRSDCQLDLLSNVFKKTDLSASMFRAIGKNESWSDLSLKEAFAFAKKTSVGLFSLITDRSDWKALSLAEALSFANKYDYNNWVMESIVGRKDWKN